MVPSPSRKTSPSPGRKCTSRLAMPYSLNLASPYILSNILPPHCPWEDDRPFLPPNCRSPPTLVIAFLREKLGLDPLTAAVLAFSGDFPYVLITSFEERTQNRLSGFFRVATTKKGYGPESRSFFLSCFERFLHFVAALFLFWRWCGFSAFRAEVSSPPAEFPAKSCAGKDADFFLSSQAFSFFPARPFPVCAS